MPDHILDLDPSSLREWLAAVGILRLVSETTEKGGVYWRLENGRYRLVAEELPVDSAKGWSEWVADNRWAWQFGGKHNVDFDADFWREQALNAKGVGVSLWCTIASDAVWHRDGKKLRASGLEYAHGGGHQHWLASIRGFVADGAVAADQLARVLGNRRDDKMTGSICRWDPACERDHALRAKAPTKDPMTQDQSINALAAIGLASFPSAPGSRGLMTPLVGERGRLMWPIWTDRLRISDLEAAICCGWTWPTMQSRRWLSGKLYCFARGEIREPEAFPHFP